VREVFGIPAGGLAVALAVALALAAAVVVTLALRNRVLVRLGVRNIPRRRARSALIVTGLMLGTTIIAAALVTGDTMSHTIRSSAISSLGQTDVQVSVRGGGADTGGVVEDAAPTAYFSEHEASIVARAAKPSPAVDGVAPAIVEPVAAQNPGARRTEPRASLFGADPAALEDFGAMTSTADGREVSLALLAAGEVFLNENAAEELAAGAGDRVLVMAGERAVPFEVRDVVDYDGTGTDGSAVLTSLAAAQHLLGREGQVKHVLISAPGGPVDGADHTDEIKTLLGPVVAPLGLEVEPVKRDALELADETGAAFMSLFTTFGTFSIAAGILLIFLIFVMLATERRAELGIARAVGTRRGHLVQLFLFEGIAYDLVAAAVGAAVGVGVAFGMVALLAGAFSATGEFDIAFAVTARSVLIAYAIGVLLTLGVVAFSAWRVSRMNIVSAIRNLPEPPPARRRRLRWLPGLAGVVLGGLLISSGVGASDLVVLGLGVSLLVLGLSAVARAAGVSTRVARTVAGVILVVWFLLPVDLILDQPRQDFSLFIVGGLMIVIGATWVIMYNADAVLGVLSWPLMRIRAVAPVVKMTMAYPLRSLFRTGVTLAMFTLVVFTLVVGGTTSGAFNEAFDDLDSYGGGFDVRATAAPMAPVRDIEGVLDRTGLGQGRTTAVGSQSILPVDATQTGAGTAPEGYLARGADDGFLEHTTYALGAKARGYGSDAEVWRAVREQPGLAVVDPLVVPRRANYNFGVMPDFRLSGLYVEDQDFAPIQLRLRDRQTGRQTLVKVIGVLSDTVPLEMSGVTASQRTLEQAFGDRVKPTIHYLALRDAGEAPAYADDLESALVSHGVQAKAMSEALDEMMGISRTFNRIVEGFLALGLIVGVAALGVISARSVVERRHHIGVLRAIGLRRGMVRLSFLLESSFIALTSIVIGTALGLAVAYNIISDSAQEPSWQNLSFTVPWGALAIIFALVYLVALATTFVPAMRASRVYPAEALRYE
jgi:putative ABC transport system permease protein